MSLDLTLLPFDHENSAFAYAHSMLKCDPSVSLFNQIEEIERMRGYLVPSDFTSFIAPGGYGPTLKTRYDRPLRYIRRADLTHVRSHGDIRNSAINRAVWAYLSRLDPETKVALYWH